ncbi:MAG: hypothetical protein A2Y14_01250 [Verrucomicrobia bacterium GWF2_51_19]|nr:MAG: hypothetical protein A2Y14_01250 [Verrucomicrobia bacterium GWF2_51_19]
MFLTFVSFGLFLRFSMSATRLSAVYFFLEAFLLFLTALSDTLMEFVVAILCAKVIYRQYTPLMTQVYAENYSHKTRGKRLSVVLVASAMVGIGFSKLGGYWLDLDLHNYTWIFFSMAAASMFCGWSLSRIPSSRVKNNATPKLLQFSYLWKDPLFGKMVLAWTLLGFGNFMTLPMRIEYLANERYGLSLSNQTVVLITAILPMVARIASMSIWGLLFDRVRFIPLRSLNNLFWILGLFCFFNFTNLWLIGLGSILIGIGMGGGFVIWNLWVTKIAPPDKAGAYMSVHTSISGLQGMLSPCVGYAILSLPHMTPAVVGWVGILLSIASLALFASHWKDTRIT